MLVDCSYFVWHNLLTMYSEVTPGNELVQGSRKSKPMKSGTFRDGYETMALLRLFIGLDLRLPGLF